MALPIKPPYLPMEAKLVDDIPGGEGWQYEPKWDGFRCVAFRDGDYLELQSKAGETLTRYFPEMVEALRALKAKRFVLDGELVVPVDGDLSFDDLLQRIHPAESRVRKLAAQTPANYILFDLLADERAKALVDHRLRDRRAALEAFAEKYLKGNSQIRLSPATTDLALAKKWFGSVGIGATLDGIIAKRLDLDYRSGERDGMVKVKKMRTADCVVAGYRYGSKATKVLGSLLLGLYDDDGLLHHVGFCSAFKGSEREKLTAMMEKLRKPTDKGGGFTGRSPGGKSRWSTERSGEWESVEPKLVVEVQYDHFSGGRFRHGTKFLRWRPDKNPRQCTMDQVESSGEGVLKLLMPGQTRRRRSKVA